MKPAWYEPNLCMCNPENPNTMGMCVTLTEPVNGEALRTAVERLRERFPYLYVRARVEGNDLIAVPNPLPVTVRNTWAPIPLNSEAANYHMLALKYEGNRLCAEVCHSITDGAGFLPYLKSLLYCYLSDVTGQRFDPEGFRLPGQPIPEAETGDPFAGLDLDAAEAPLYQKPPIADYYRFQPSPQGGAGSFHYLRLPEAEVMRYCKDNDGSPNVLMSVLLAKAIRRMDPDSGKTVTCVVAIDHKAQAGNRQSYRMFVDTATVDMPAEEADCDIMKACTKARGQLMLQAQPENTLFTMKTRKLGYEKMEQMPLQMCVDMVKKAIAQPRATVSVSYADSRGFGPLDGYIREFYVLSEPLYVTSIMCEIACVNHGFFLALAQRSVPEAFFEAFLAELDAIGIPCDVLRSEPFHLCGVRYDGLEGVTL